VEDLEAIVADAQALVAQRAWGAAGIAWARVAAVAMEAGRRDTARSAWDAAGESWRRDDRVDSAARALTMALGLAERERAVALAQVKLAGVLGELGRLTDAESLCARAYAACPPDDPLRAVVVDTWVNARLALGQRDRCNELVDELAVLPDSAQLAARFRRAQLLRQDGALGAAVPALESLMESLQGDARLLPALAGARAELGEVELLRGEHARAVSLLEQAFAEQAEAGRRSLQLRAEAARVRVLLERGLPALVHGLDDGLAYAQERGLVLLECDVRVARGMALAERAPERARADLERAVQLADAAGSEPRSGRARYEWAALASDTLERRLSILKRATVQLASSRPWAVRCDLLRARLIAEASPDEALDLARAAHSQFVMMDMRLDAALGDSLVRTLAARNSPPV